MTDSEIRLQVTKELAEAMKKFAPDLMKEFADRWNYARLTEDAKLERFLALLR